MTTYEDVLFQARKTAKHLRRLEEMIEEVNPLFNLDDVSIDDSFGYLADEIEDEDHFLSQFKEREFRVKVFMADEYEVTVTAMSDEQAVEKVVSSPGDYAHEFEPTQMVDKTDNVLTGYPYEPTAEEKA